MFALVALLFLSCAQIRYVAATIEHRFREIESVAGTLCPEEHITYNSSTPSAIVCTTLCSSVGNGCRGVNFDLTSHVCLGCNTSDLPSSKSSMAPSGMVFQEKLSLNDSTLTEVTATEVDTINVQTDDFDLPSWISGSALLPDKLILADYNNRNIKMLNLQTATVTLELKVSDPWDVAIITDHQVVITLDEGRKIAFLNVTSVLIVDRKMNVRGACTGIVHDNGKLVVSYWAPPKIEIMNLDGIVEKKIEQSIIFNEPNYIALSPGHDALYVSDHERGCVEKLSMDGIVDNTYEDIQLISPMAVVVDKQGRVLVCGKASGNIHLLTPDLTKIKLLVDGLRSPYSLSLCQSMGRLYVGSKYDDYVRVYQLS